jgi:hypothetical protein
VHKQATQCDYFLGIYQNDNHPLEDDHSQIGDDLQEDLAKYG